MAGTTIGDALKSPENNFDAIRLFAALSVLHSHSYAQLGQRVDTFGYLFGYSGGQIGVGAFFVISGFLVSASVLNRDTSSYFASRFLRIVPGLFAVSLLTAFVLGPLLTTLPLEQYFRDPATLAYLKTATVYGYRNSLPGVFVSNPLTLSVNGSLWTLPVETLCYLCLPWLALAGLLKPKRIVLVTAVMVIGAFVMALFFGISERTAYLIAGATPLFVFWKYAIYFLFGAIFYVHRFEIPLNGGFAAICFVTLFAVGGTPQHDWAFLPSLTYVVFYLALAKPCTGWLNHKVGDISYGTYIWAFPVQQSVISILGPTMSPDMLSLIATPITLMIAFASWHLIEKPALGLKKRFGAPDRHPEILSADRPDSGQPVVALSG